MKYDVEKAGTSILFCGSQFQLGLLHARELVPHGEFACQHKSDSILQLLDSNCFFYSALRTALKLESGS